MGTDADLPERPGGPLATGTGLPWQVEEDGLRNITGEQNADGSFTIFGTTSTVSDELTHDLGADPNKIVSITIGANSTSANTMFSVVESAAAGERFGGVAIAPAVPEPCAYAQMFAGLGCNQALLGMYRSASGPVALGLPPAIEPPSEP